ncbi:hypothetical protein [Candidatus Marithrix sp. Canyon 246]|uniref:hypothetical protein n=1 Tax=Candidatus Marithrix sp. Canyon 246 TaxID=1827136 RepID=UPI00149604EB|nr:hypothetical protein [Candidatus Marithrix sp. Canyon 246]
MKHPIINYSELKEQLDNHITTGFGGVKALVYKHRQGLFKSQIQSLLLACKQNP